MNSRRSTSPTRETTIILRSARPPVVIEGFNGLEEAPPTHVEELGDRLAKGMDAAFIPQNLQARMFLFGDRTAVTKI